ncbi:Rab1a [Hexamita inflata]|uniref:Rab1a n=1 Tax=Hexamita inflata TaxID=28002 RepID=A0AA86P3S3_9EUKA|nr:Rab1a [Hexamita inflata]CAI9941745.1 Rab1a [Hexamita inflata]CAI9944815.1 Rab1a [Hexamita inflata]
MSGEHDYLYKMLLIGDSAVGKSSLLLRFCDRLFNNTYITTIGVDFKIRSLQCPYPSAEQPSSVKLQIWDTAGQEKFRTICQTYYRGSHGIMMVYDVTNRESFESIEMWLREINIHAGTDVVKLLVGSKIDKEGRVVSTEEGKNLADKMGIHFIETSAQSGSNVEPAFTDLAIEIMKQQGSTINNRPDMLIQATIKDDEKKVKSGCC